jgi:hypothetical protein
MLVYRRSNQRLGLGGYMMWSALLANAREKTLLLSAFAPLKGID